MTAENNRKGTHWESTVDTSSLGVKSINIKTLSVSVDWTRSSSETVKQPSGIWMFSDATSTFIAKPNPGVTRHHVRPVSTPEHGR